MVLRLLSCVRHHQVRSKQPAAARLDQHLERGRGLAGARYRCHYQHLAAIPAETFETVVEAHMQTGEPISTASIARVADAIEELPAPARLISQAKAAGNA